MDSIPSFNWETEGLIETYDLYEEIPALLDRALLKVWLFGSLSTDCIRLINGW